jgi:uncharacterized membrane protein (DUF106 family)
MNETINETLNQTINQAITNNENSFLSHYIPFTGFPAADIFIITFIVAIFTTIVNKHMTDQVKIKALKKEMKELQKEMREHIKGNKPKKAQAVQQKIMKKNMELMKHSMNFKMMMVTMLPLILLFSLVSHWYGHFGDILNLGFAQFGWLGTYIIFSIVNSIMLKKILDVA